MAMVLEYAYQLLYREHIYSFKDPCHGRKKNHFLKTVGQFAFHCVSAHVA